MTTDTDKEEDGTCVVFIGTPSLAMHRETIKLTLERLQPDTDVVIGGLKLRKFNENLINTILKHLINDTPAEIVKILKDTCGDDYLLLTIIAEEIKESVESVSFGLGFDCTLIDILDDDLVVAKGRFY